MAPDGELAFTFGQVGRQQRFALNFGALPWLEASFRYSHVVGRFPGYDTLHYYDRSFGLKVRLMKEGAVLPDVSVGIRDILGTGVYGSEYVVASKRIGDFDLTGGIGWGNLADTMALSNPLGQVFSSFDVRSAETSSGLVDLKQFFHGPRVGVFGGINWQTPVPYLSVLVEYATDKYRGYVYEGGLHVRSPVNVGLSYQPFSTLGITAGWFYGSTYGLSIHLSGDPTKTYPSAMRIGPEVPRPAIRTDNEQQSALSVLQASNTRTRAMTPTQRARQEILQALYSQSRGVRDVQIHGNSLVVDAHINGDANKQCTTYARLASTEQSRFTTVALTDLQSPSGTVVLCQPPRETTLAMTSAQTADLLGGGAPAADLEQRLKAELDAQSLIYSASSVGTSEMWIYYENYRYQNANQAVGRVARILMAVAPTSIETFHLIPTFLGVPAEEIVVSRSGLERTLGEGVTNALASDAFVRQPAPMSSPGLDKAHGRYPIFTWSFDPKLTQRVFDPDAPIQFMVYGDLAAILQIAPGLSLATELTGTIWSSYTFSREAGSVLPHVRTDILSYLKHGEYGISALQLDYRARLAPEIYADIRGGLLEDMFMGAGAQILWRPERSRFAFGADIYQVWQRDYDRLFGTRPYEVLTGHVSAYYRSPWYGLNYAVHVGRYLAGDYGGTFEMTRRFEGGVEIGAWATFTDVPFNRFGEGSFDKGIIIHIPFEWGLPVWSQASYDLRLNSLTRDGGQRLAGDDSLSTSTFGNSYGEYAEHLDDLVDP